MPRLDDTRTEMSEVVMPDATNNLGRALGGSILHWMDICGVIAGRRFSGGQVVTAAMDHVDFMAPIDLGDIVVVEGYVFEAGTTSMAVHVGVRAERPATNRCEAAAASTFTLVAVDDDHEPRRVPELRCPTEMEDDLRERARVRRGEDAETAG